jgi:aryl-alcohol dehydrogenase-like predicted oxidoreductase
MQLRRLGRDGPEISAIGFGAWEAGGGSVWGEEPPVEQTVTAIRSVFDAGITWIDTAEVYGSGRSEERVAQAIEGRRDQVVLFTKVAPAPEGTGFRPDEVAKACRGSLERLRTDRIDLYQLHWPDSTGVPIEDTWGAMTDLVREGLVRHIGVSNFDRALIERCEHIRHVDSLQQELSMLVLDDRELIRWCGEQGIGVLAYGPLAYGLLTGAISRETRFGRGDHRAGADNPLFGREGRERSLAVLDGMRPIAERLGCSAAQLALAWTIAQPGVTAAIAGSRDERHVRANAEAGDIELDRAARSELDALVSREPGSA